MVSGRLAQGIQAGVPESHAQPERVGDGSGGEAKTHSDSIDERDGSGTRPATLSRRTQDRVHVGPVGDDGNLGERPRRKKSHATQRDRQRRNPTLVAGWAVDRFRCTYEERNLHLYRNAERRRSEIAGGRHARECLPELVTGWTVGILRIFAYRRLAGLEDSRGRRLAFASDDRR